MDRSIQPALWGVIAAIAVTSTMDAMGYSTFSALPLFALTGFFWALQKFTRKEIGLQWGDLTSHGWALAYPVVVLGLAAAIALFFGAVDVTDADWQKTLTNIGLGSTVGILMVMITEEGFFRGWLWASLKRAGRSDREVLVLSTLAFMLWHVSAVSLDTGYDLPAWEIPIFLINVTILDLIWGILRLISGSVLVPAVSHAVWNGIDYPLFGFGEKVGALGITDTHWFGPEVGLAGIVLGLAFLTLVWRNCVTPFAKISPPIH
jgi:membrane protease YdiL (CAAX protease family)